MLNTNIELVSVAAGVGECGYRCWWVWLQELVSVAAGVGECGCRCWWLHTKNYASWWVRLIAARVGECDGMPNTTGILVSVGVEAC